MDTPTIPKPKFRKYSYNRGIPCPKCDHNSSRKLDVRPVNNRPEIRRRRECDGCGFRFTTYEAIPEHVTEVIVLKRDGSRETYDSEKLKRSLTICSVHRAISKERISRIVRSITLMINTRKGEEVLKKGRGRPSNISDFNKSVIQIVIPSSTIAQYVMSSLKALDQVSYIRYCSVHMRFGTKEDFEQLIATLY